MYCIDDFIESWRHSEGKVSSTREILDWVDNLNEVTRVEIEETEIQQNSFWFIDEQNGTIHNQKNSFFQVSGLKEYNGVDLVHEQPVILQNEIGFLGILCQKINGVLHFLMQAKIEPGNINCIQISPTIQATRSNFTRAHGGATPKYLEYFAETGAREIIYDQLQSEQGARFYKKRNRNMIVALDETEEVEMFANFKWMTLGQLKNLMKIDNLVNMDTRTVISGIPFYKLLDRNDQMENEVPQLYKNSGKKTELVRVQNWINDFKMYSDYHAELCSLNDLNDWYMNEKGIFSLKDANFEVKYYNIHIEGREVTEWMQPLFKAKGIAVFGLISSVVDGQVKYLIKLRHEIGTFDEYEMSPTIQLEANQLTGDLSELEKLFFEKHENGKDVQMDVLLSEEGGRFYHEQNRNIIINIPAEDIPELDESWMWIDYMTLNQMIQNCYNLNIQLRNLLSLIQI